MAIETIHFEQGLSRTPLSISSISHHQVFRNYFAEENDLESRQFGNPKKPGSLTSAQQNVGCLGVSAKHINKKLCPSPPPRKVNMDEQLFTLGFLFVYHQRKPNGKRANEEKANWVFDTRHPTPAFPFIVMAFPSNGRSHFRNAH